MMRIMYVDQAGQLLFPDVMPFDWQMEATQRPSLLWIDLDDGEATATVEDLLTQRFGFHPLAIDDALHEIHMPKIDDWETYVYLALQDIVYERGQSGITLPELDIFMGRQFLVTYHVGEVTAVDRVWQMCERNNRWLQHGADHLLYRLIDEIVNNFTAVLEQLESDIMQLEGEIFEDPSAFLLGRLTTYKRMVLQIRRVLAPQREVVSKMARNPYDVIGTKDQVYFRDVYDHMVRLYDLSDSVRDMVMGSMEIYLTVVNNRMNDIMKTLTIITTLFMPLTFITGFFGMNFFESVLPSQLWTGAWTLGLTLLSIILLPLIMFTWIRRHAWM